MCVYAPRAFARDIDAVGQQNVMATQPLEEPLAPHPDPPDFGGRRRQWLKVSVPGIA